MTTIPLGVQPRSQVVLWKVVCEGDSEEIYAKELKRYLKKNTLKPFNAKGGVISNVKKKAENCLKTGGVIIMDADRRNSPEDLLLFRQWCAGRNIKLLISNPTFEVWLLMHFRDVSPNMDQTDLENALSECLGRRYEKDKGIRPNPKMIGDAFKRSRNKIPKGEDSFEYVLTHPGSSMVHELSGILGENL